MKQEKSEKVREKKGNGKLMKKKRRRKREGNKEREGDKEKEGRK